MEDGDLGQATILPEELRLHLPGGSDSDSSCKELVTEAAVAATAAVLGVVTAIARGRPQDSDGSPSPSSAPRRAAPGEAVSPERGKVTSRCHELYSLHAKRLRKKGAIRSQRAEEEEAEAKRKVEEDKQRARERRERVAESGNRLCTLEMERREQLLEQAKLQVADLFAKSAPFSPEIKDRGNSDSTGQARLDGLYQHHSQKLLVLKQKLEQKEEAEMQKYRDKSVHARSVEEGASHSGERMFEDYREQVERLEERRRQAEEKWSENVNQHFVHPFDRTLAEEDLAEMTARLYEEHKERLAKLQRQREMQERRFEELASPKSPMGSPHTRLLADMQRPADYLFREAAERAERKRLAKERLQEKDEREQRLLSVHAVAQHRHKWDAEKVQELVDRISKPLKELRADRAASPSPSPDTSRTFSLSPLSERRKAATARGHRPAVVRLMNARSMPILPTMGLAFGGGGYDEQASPFLGASPGAESDGAESLGGGEFRGGRLEAASLPGSRTSSPSLRAALSSPSLSLGGRQRGLTLLGVARPGAAAESPRSRTDSPGSGRSHLTSGSASPGRGLGLRLSAFSGFAPPPRRSLLAPDSPTAVDPASTAAEQPQPQEEAPSSPGGSQARAKSPGGRSLSLRPNSAVSSPLTGQRQRGTVMAGVVDAAGRNGATDPNAIAAALQEAFEERKLQAAASASPAQSSPSGRLRRTGCQNLEAAAQALPRSSRLTKSAQALSPQGDDAFAFDSPSPGGPQARPASPSGRSFSLLPNSPASPPLAAGGGQRQQRGTMMASLSAADHSARSPALGPSRESVVEVAAQEPLDRAVGTLSPGGVGTRTGSPTGRSYSLRPPSPLPSPALASQRQRGTMITGLAADSARSPAPSPGFSLAPDPVWETPPLPQASDSAPFAGSPGPGAAQTRAASPAGRSYSLRPTSPASALAPGPRQQRGTMMAGLGSADSASRSGTADPSAIAAALREALEERRAQAPSGPNSPAAAPAPPSPGLGLGGGGDPPSPAAASGGRVRRGSCQSLGGQEAAAQPVPLTARSQSFLKPARSLQAPRASGIQPQAGPPASPAAPVRPGSILVPAQVLPQARVSTNGVHTFHSPPSVPVRAGSILAPAAAAAGSGSTLLAAAAAAAAAAQNQAAARASAIQPPAGPAPSPPKPVRPGSILVPMGRGVVDALQPQATPDAQSPPQPQPQPADVPQARGSGGQSPSFFAGLGDSLDEAELSLALWPELSQASGGPPDGWGSPASQADRPPLSPSEAAALSRRLHEEHAVRLRRLEQKRRAQEQRLDELASSPSLISSPSPGWSSPGSPSADQRRRSQFHGFNEAHRRALRHQSAKIQSRQAKQQTHVDARCPVQDLWYAVRAHSPPPVAPTRPRAELIAALFRALANGGGDGGRLGARPVQRFAALCGFEATATEWGRVYLKLRSEYGWPQEGPDAAEFAKFVNDEQGSANLSDEELSEVLARVKARNAMVASLFRALDKERNGRLRSWQMRRYAHLCGWEGSDAEWERQYRYISNIYKWNPDQGVDLFGFTEVVNHTTAFVHCNDEELCKVLAEVGAVRKAKELTI